MFKVLSRFFSGLNSKKVLSKVNFSDDSFAFDRNSLKEFC